MLRTALLLFIFPSSIFYTNAQSETHDNCLNIHNTYLSTAFDLTKNCVGFSAPVSGRAYGYISVGMYEATVDFLPTKISLQKQLNGYTRNVEVPEKVNWALAVNAADYQLLSYFYRNMPPTQKERLDSLYTYQKKEYASKVRKKTVKASELYGQEIANGIIEWSKTDGAENGHLNNFPEDFEIVKCESCWERTFPGYLPALTPHWGNNRPMLKQSPDVYKNMEIFDFDTDSASVMYKEAAAVYQNAMNENPEYEIIAEYWDDAAGYSGTPSGHFFTIASSVVASSELELEQAVQLYATLGVAINDAFIGSFYLKYKFNFIRPITYIHRYIEPQFNSRLASPPFPEYPSGHSFQSGAATEVMKSIFGDTTIIVDETNKNRNDIDGSPRTYQSFTEMSEEISISRFYGGIHFLKTLNNSLDYGRRIGQYVLATLKFSNE